MISHNPNSTPKMKPPEFKPSRETDTKLVSTLHDLEESLGRYSIRTAKRFHDFISMQPEYPLVLTSLPFTAVEQVLFMATSQVFPTSSCKCDRCKAHNSRFVAVLECLAGKYKVHRGEFVSVAHQVLSKVACGQTMFMAVFTGESIGTKRIRKHGTMLFPGWDMQPVNHREVRNFEYRPFRHQVDSNKADLRNAYSLPLPPLIYMTTSLIQSPDALKQVFQHPPEFPKTSSPNPPRLCDKILARAHCYFSSVYARDVFIRIYFTGSLGSYYYITVRVTRKHVKFHPHYEIFIMKGSMYTNIDA
jgi:hypothetical protein